MPHITLQVSSNIRIDANAFFSSLTEVLVGTGHAPALGIKCRVERSDHYFIIDGNPEYKMANLLFSLREGRTDDVLNTFSEIGLACMEDYFEEYINNKSIILSTQFIELKRGRDLTKNFIRKRFEQK